MIELLRNSKDKRARKLAKKRVRAAVLFSPPQFLSKSFLSTTDFGSLEKLSRVALGRVPADAHGLELYSSGRLDVRSERSMSCKVSSLSREGPDIRSR